MGKYCVLLAAIGVCLWDQPALAGPWGLQQGESYTGVHVNMTKHEEVVAFDGTHMPVGDFRFLNFSLSSEYGLTDDWTLSLQVPYEINRGDDPAMARRVSALGDLRLGAKRQIWKEPDHAIALSGSIGLKIPGSDYPTDVLTAPGDGQSDVEFRLLAGKILGSDSRPAYWDAETGYRFRGGSTGDEFFLYLEGGKQISSVWQGRLFFEHTDQLSGFGIGEPGWTPGDFPAVQEDIDRLGVGASYRLKHDVLLDLFYARIVHVENSAPGWHAGVSLVFHRRGL